MELEPALRDRLAQMERRLGRPLRALCIGNIANNAYYTARLLRRVGIECDVIAYDYYHIMGCPEWEEADFENQIADQFHPDWSALDMAGYQRPAWFVQGPMELCLAYLQAKDAGQAREKAGLRRAIGLFNRTRRRDRFDTLGVGVTQARLFARRLINLFLHPARLANRLRIEARGLRVGRSPPLRRLGALLAAMTPVAVGLSRLAASGLRAGTGNMPAHDSALRYCAALCARFDADFPTRADKLSVADLQPYLYQLPAWRGALKRYDIVQGFATDPIWPLLTERPYFALEHGTLRDIPFADTTQGRITALGYHFAEHVFVTNADCLENAHRLAGERVTSINHPYDEDANFPVTGWESLRQELLTELDADFLLFHPTRQDWVAGTGYADKANDVFIRALAELRGRGLRVGAVCCAWGRNVEESRALLQSLGVARHVRWMQPLAHVRFLRVARACGLVVDQFKLGGFGGITFKTLAAGIPVCTNLDVEATIRSFGEAPPVLRCGDQATLVREIAALCAEPARLDALATASREWIKRHHSGAQVLHAFVARYLDHLESRVAAAAPTSSVA